MPRFPIAEWQVEQVRLTAFPIPGETTLSSEWWSAVTDLQPDEATTNPKKGSALIQGEFPPGMLILKLEPDRIDWLLTPSEDGDQFELLRGFPVLGPGTEPISAFSSIAEKWLSRKDLPAIGRIAFGAVLMHPEEDRRAGYIRLPEYVPVQVNPESSDFIYQINLPTVPTATGIEGLQLNRLSRWSVAALKSMKLTVTGTALQPRLFPDVAALRLELDINNVPTLAGRIPEAKLIDLYRELVEA